MLQFVEGLQIICENEESGCCVVVFFVSQIIMNLALGLDV